MFPRLVCAGIVTRSESPGVIYITPSLYTWIDITEDDGWAYGDGWEYTLYYGVRPGLGPNRIPLLLCLTGVNIRHSPAGWSFNGVSVPMFVLVLGPVVDEQSTRILKSSREITLVWIEKSSNNDQRKNPRSLGNNIRPERHAFTTSIKYCTLRNTGLHKPNLNAPLSF